MSKVNKYIKYCFDISLLLFKYVMVLVELLNVRFDEQNVERFLLGKPLMYKYDKSMGQLVEKQSTFIP